MSQPHLLHVTDIEYAGDGLDQGSRPTFLLLHGFGGSSFTWRSWAPALSLRGRVLLVDMKGFGEAPKPDDGCYSPRDLAEHVVRFIRDEDLGRLILIGHSLGGGVALLTALTLVDMGEDRLERLVLIGAAAYRQRLPPFVALARRPRFSAFMLRLLGPARVIRLALWAIVHDRSSVTEQQVAAYARPLRTAPGVRALLDAGRQIVPDDIDDIATRYGEIRIPTLLMWGRHDRVVPLSIAHRLDKAIPHARLEIIEACGHVPHEELPVASLRILETFLDEE